MCVYMEAAVGADALEDAALDDRLLSGVTALEHLLTANLLPDDFDLEALASCDAAAIAECEACPHLCKNDSSGSWDQLLISWPKYV